MSHINVESDFCDTVRSAADEILLRYPNEPLRALWEALTDSVFDGPDLALAIVKDPRCGLDRSALLEENNCAALGFEELEQYVDWVFKAVATPLTLAVFAGRVDALEVLLAEGHHTLGDVQSFNCLHAAAAVGDVAAIELLISKGFAVDAVDTECNHALHWAANFGHVAATEILIDRGATVDAADDFEGTPLHYAAYSGYQAVIEVLIDNGHAVDASNKSGSTPLHWAAYNGHLECLTALIAKGADVNVADKNGTTPIHWAIQNGCDPAIALLEAEGAAVTPKLNK